MPFRNPFDAPPIRPSALPGEADPTGEIHDKPDPLRDSDEAPPDPPGTRLDVQFIGAGAGYTRLWLAGALLSLLTLGLYAPWAAVAKRRYLAAHTLVGGFPLAYHGSPRAILRGRALVVGVLAAGLALTFAWPLAHPFLAAAAILAAPWFLRSAFAFQARNTVWRGLHFDCVTSQRDAFKAVAPLLLWPATQLAVELAMRYWTSAQLEVLLSLLPYLVLIIVWPRVVAAVLHLRLAGTRYGSTRFELTIPLNEFRKVFYRGLGLFWLKIGVAAAVLLVALALLGNADTLALAQPLVMFTVASTGTGFVRARRFNLGVHRLVGEGGVRLRSSLTPERLSYTYLFNALWIVATCGLAAPWRRVVTLRQRARHFAVFFEADAARFRRAAMASAGALGEAAAEGLDLDLSL